MLDSAIRITPVSHDPEGVGLARRGRRPVAWAGFSDCQQCPIRASALFAHLTAVDLEAIHYPIDEIRLAAGSVLCNAGERADYLYTVREGALKIEHWGQSGVARVTAMMIAGDLIGLPAYVLGKYDARVVALTGSRVCRLPIATLRELERRSPRFMQGMHEKWHSALQASNAWMVDIGLGSVRERLARLLLRFPEDASGMTHVSSRRELGALMGEVALETVSRQISAMRREGIVQFMDSRGRRLALDRAALAEIAGFSESPREVVEA
ncbi:MAG: Crp/Fnr family transcriptional regulator [Burkholderiaceae bacterium]